MSDLYDSLEDEGDEKYSCDSLRQPKRGTIASIKGLCLNDKQSSCAPFYLTQKANALPNLQYNKVSMNKERSFLPKIGSLKEKGGDKTSNILITNEVLSKQGLQLNNDGSFTKSPRSETDELPFITREYRNLQFQKRKTYQMKKRTPFVKVQRRDIFTFAEKPQKGVSMSEIISLRKKKGTSEELLTSGGSLSSHSTRKGREFGMVRDNLTDSMKERLIQKQNEIKLRMQAIKNPRLGLEGRRNLKPLCSKSQCTSNDPQPTTELGVQESSRKTFRRRLNQSEVLLNGGKPRLSYSERRQQEIGFNPLSLRPGKKIISDTTRSNFGDSTADRLSEISSRLLSSEDITDDEDEETFYKNIIEKEKNRKLGMQASTRSAPLVRINESVKGVSAKDQKQSKGSLKSISTHKSLSTSINMPILPDNNSTKKSSRHYCSASSSPMISKTELALKARTYGYLANARNIFRLKTQSEGKLSPKVVENKSSENFGAEARRNSIPNSGAEFRRLPRPTRSLCREGHKRVVLPQVNPTEALDRNLKSEILDHISSCMDEWVHDDAPQEGEGISILVNNGIESD